MFLLVVTNGYSVEHTPYQTRDEAKTQMKKVWKVLAKDLQGDEWKEMLSLGEEQAIPYHNGENVFQMHIRKREADGCSASFFL